MGKHTLRKDMTCLNCNHVVEKRFCPNCGQENKHTRESFHYLFTHFFEDLTHYDGSFWKTIKYLLFFPAKLTKEYLAGKRQAYVPPVKLYIFISFITFFLLTVLPVFQGDENDSDIKVSSKLKVTESNPQNVEKETKLSEVPVLGNYKSVSIYDSIQNTLSDSKKDKGITHWAKRKMAKISEKNTVAEFFYKTRKSVFQNLPKAIFLYLPLFAFVLWLFHNKKRWYYYDHGIFTLHYYSMLLISFSIFMLIIWISGWFGSKNITEIVMSITITIMLFWWIFYFFRSHSRFYGESKLISRTKCSFIFLINSIFILLFLILLLVYSALNVN